MEKFYKFAGVEIAVSIPEDRMYPDDRSLAPFAVDTVTDPHRFILECADALEAPNGNAVAVDPGFRVYDEGEWTVRYIGSVQGSWEAAYIRAAHRGKEHRVQLKAAQFPERIGAKTVLNCLSAEHLVAQNGGFIFHSSYMERNGEAVLFTAPSGTGKSTQAALWERLRGAEVINGDRSAVRVENGAVLACGVPFAGSSQICKNKTLPLAAIVYLKQAAFTSIRRLGGAEAFRRVWEGCSVNAWDREDVCLVSETVQRVLAAVPVFELACTPDESAIIALEGVLTR